MAKQLCDSKYRIAENIGGRKHWRIWRIESQSPKFSPSILWNFNFCILFAVHVIQVGQRVDVLFKYFRHINGKHSNDETLPSPAGTLSTLMPSTGIFAANHHLDRERVSFHHGSRGNYPG